MVDFSRPLELEEWLQSLPTTALRAFATRAALQVLPYAFGLADSSSRSFNHQQLLLACFRGNVVSGLVGVGLSEEASSLPVDALETLNTANNTDALSTLVDPNDTITAVAATFYSTRADDAQIIHDLMADVPTYGTDRARALTVDAEALTIAPESTAQLFATELWHGPVPEPYAALSQAFFESAPGTPWEFWAEWYKKMLNGNPLDWELQRRVALIENSIWMEGPEAVAREIEKIQARRHVELTLAELNDSFKAQPLSRLGIGGNNPPESIQDEHLVGALTLIWEAEKELSNALDQESPAREWIEAILAKFKFGLAGFLKWCASKGDLAVDTLIKWGIPATGAGYAVKYPEKIEALIKAVEQWLPFLS
ncbi:hypothetical protein [Ruegeria sp. HKCCA4812]|uniref:hypothetical protein n=1 Tax=Ruegeria sp. HKCCA4812 TaxID=2682993 RepID=UPI001489C28F|nr:hypothetical protein [Ruegeria sp. HKCCA4812]